jgi:hypothetical protein
VKDWLLHPRVQESGDRLVIRYPGAVTLLWIGLAVLGLGFGFVAAGSGDRPESALAGLGLGVISTFVAWFAANPAIVADSTGIRLFPIFGTRTTFGWGEVRSVGVREVRAARGRGPALLVEATEDCEAKIDSLWVGATRPNLEHMAEHLERFAVPVLGGRGVFAPEPDENENENENVF